VINVAALLERQQSLTAVDRFSQHEVAGTNTEQRLYRELIPLERPKPGEQYSFEVDLDACTGCKACVAACHSLNGLDTHEVFRSVGLLRNHASGGAPLKTVTSSCHHCLDPACLTGCPVVAYEKDPLSGIVKHLDDQCFGCQYCTLMCPYDAPKYNAEKGIVRKCDMCSDRLAHGQAPACVEACPSGAIRIRSVAKSELEARVVQGFLPGVAAPSQTQPTTRYLSREGLGAFAPIDELRAEPQHAPLSLVVMLTLTQLAAGLALMSAWSGHEPQLAGLLVAASAAGLGVTSSLFHLGRPWLAFRAVLGLRTSWLSREAVALGLFAALAGAAGAHAAFSPGAVANLWLTRASAAAGVLGVWCSVMVYAATRRQHWSLPRTARRFFGGLLLLGAAGTRALQLLPAGSAASEVHDLPLWVLGAALLQSAGAAWSARATQPGGARRERALLDSLGLLVWARWGALAAGGMLGPLLLVWLHGSAAKLAACASFVCLLLSELGDRYLFFAAAPPSRMPGGMK
jgi:Fe-S-cluster-containing dehydrogenase component/DMSO reductase anchor subunit